MQPNNQNPYYPPREPVSQPGSQPPAAVQPQPYPMASELPKHGRPWGWIITTVSLVLALIGVTVFGVWAFSGRQDYKNNADKKVAAAAEVAKKQQIDVDNKRFAEELKNPLKTYTGPDAYGSVSIQYPKTWSGYVTVSSSTSGALVDGVFHPDIIPGFTSSNGRPALALRLQIINQDYSSVINKYTSSVQRGVLTATPYALPKMPEQVGTKFTGQLAENLTGTEVVIPLRDKTLVLGTDTDQYLADFNTYILPNVTFVP